MDLGNSPVAHQLNTLENPTASMERVCSSST